MPGTGADTHHEKATYDQLGRPFQAFDASRTEARFDHNGVRYAYSAHGHLERLQDAVGTLDGGGTFTPSAAYRTVTAMDARGNVTAETLGNGVKRTHAFDGRTGRLLGIEAGKSSANGLQDLAYQWDALGNLKSRARNVGASTLTETFGYDGLNRLKTHQAGSGTVQSTAYDGYGNIRSRTGVGTYAYGADSGGSGRPHAVASVTSGGTAVTHAYDANGSNVSSSDGRTIAYAAFGKATSIAKGGSKSEFAYGPNRSRFKRVDTDGGGDVTTTLYLGNVERITLPGGTVETKRYIGGVAILTTGPARGSCPANATQYVLRDHLGSVDELLDAQGRKARSMAFAAWGERANPADLAPLPGAEAASFDACATTRGFTGHEMLDAVGAVHMNGRIHDPALGRFLQADPFVQFPGNLQSHNRYSYALNNPLAYTDPSGHFIFSLAATAYLAGAKAGIATIVATVAAAGFGDALLQGASFGQALRAGFLSGVSAAAFSGIGSGLEARFSGGFAAGLSPWGFGLKVLAHGAVGGITSTLGGGRFGHGFAAAGFTALGTSFNNSRHVGGLGFSPLRVAMGAAIGGTASRITGGKFANGAVTGAFSQAFNNEQAEVEFEERLRDAHQEAKVEADKARSDISDRIKASDGEPVTLLQEELDAIRLHEALTLQINGEFANRSFVKFYSKARQADGWFFFGGRASTKFRLNGTGTSVLGSDINYYYLGMAVASADRSTPPMRGAIVTWNLSQAVFESQSWHDVRQTVDGQKWMVDGYQFYIDHSLKR